MKKQYVVNKQILSRYIAALIILAIAITGLVMLWVKATESWDSKSESSALEVTKTAWNSGVRGTPQGGPISFTYSSSERTFTFRKVNDTFEMLTFKKLTILEGGVCKYSPSYPLVGLYTLIIVAAGLALSKRIIRGPKGRREDD